MRSWRGDSLQVLARNALGEAIIATPGIGDGKQYVRTAGYVWAFAPGGSTA